MKTTDTVYAVPVLPQATAIVAAQATAIMAATAGSWRLAAAARRRGVLKDRKRAGAMVGSLRLDYRFLDTRNQPLIVFDTDSGAPPDVL